MLWDQIRPYQIDEPFPGESWGDRWDGLREKIDLLLPVVEQADPEIKRALERVEFRPFGAIFLLIPECPIGKNVLLNLDLSEDETLERLLIGVDARVPQPFPSVPGIHRLRAMRANNPQGFELQWWPAAGCYHSGFQAICFGEHVIGSLVFVGHELAHEGQHAKDQPEGGASAEMSHELEINAKNAELAFNAAMVASIGRGEFRNDLRAELAERRIRAERELRALKKTQG